MSSSTKLMNVSQNRRSYKISRYNHILSNCNGTYFIYNAFTNTIAHIPEKLKDLLDSRNPIELDSVLQHSSIKKKLVKGGYIVKEKRDEIGEAFAFLNQARNSGTWLGITIAPTMDCNFQCGYCFEKKDANAWMDDSIADKVLSFLEFVLQGKTNLSVSWYGGEPTLAVERIEYLSEKIDKMVNSLGVALYSEIITNGYNLGPDIQKRLASCYISRYQITLDGPPEIHNLRRVPKTGGESFWKIVNNIKDLMKSYQVDIRVNLDKLNINHVDQLIAILWQEGILNDCSLGFSHVDAITDTSAGYGKHCFTMPEFAREVLHIYRRNKDILQNFPYPESIHVCGALGPNSYVIDPYGGLYRCWTAIGDQRERIGSVCKPEAINNNDKMASFKIEDDPECRKCKILPICMGGCPYKYLVLKKSKDRCVKWKYNLQEALQDYGEWWEANQPPQGKDRLLNV